MKKILLGLATCAVVVSGVAVMSAFEAHIINVTAHIENALAVSPHGIDFGTVFPQEYREKDFTIRLSDSFMNKDQTEVRDVMYKIVQKPKPWRDDFKDGVYPPHRSLIFVDPDPGKGEGHLISGGKLTLTTGNDVEDLFGPYEPTPGTDWTAPRMVMHMGGNFTIETKVSADPTGHPGSNGEYQSGGILVYGSDGNVIRLELTRWGTGTAGKSAVYMESQENGIKVGKRWTGNNFEDEVYLKLERKGDKFTGYYSTDGSSWTEVPWQEGENPIINDKIGDYPQVGVAVTDNNADKSNNSFSAKFEYVEMNGGYLDLCPFLSKIPEPETGDKGVPSYYIEAQNRCEDPDPGNLGAYGYLAKCYPGESCSEDIRDCWKVDLKVPPVDGYAAQDWPDSCRQWVVPTDGADYGCDLWIEVVKYSYF